VNTDTSKDRTRPATGAEQVQAAGLDYNNAPFVNANGTDTSKFVKDGEVHRLEGTIDKEIENKAEVAVGAGVFARAQTRAATLEKARTDAQAAGATGDSEVFVPKMLRTDATEDPGDKLPGMMMRPRGEAKNTTVEKPDGTKEVHPEMDPRTGLGYSMTERLHQDVIPNQERTMRKAVPLKGHADDATITRADDHQAKLQLAPDGKKMEPVPGLSPSDQAMYTDPDRVKNPAK
jgi:hypothetical protein